MNEFLVLLQAKLDEAKSKGLINSDISSLQGQLDKLKLQVELDPNAAQKLANDIGKLINQKITISNINIDTNQAVRNAQQSGQQIGDALNQGISKELSKSQNAIDNFKKSLSNAGKSSSEINNLIEKVKSLNVQIESLRFSESSNGFMNIDVSGLDNLNNKVKITQSLIQDLQTKKWSVTNTNTSIISTKELDRINKVFADYTAKLAQFKSTNSEILSGLSVPIAGFENKLSGLKNGTTTIDEIVNSFKSLNTEASNITANFSRQLSPIDSAIRTLAKGEETIAGLRAEIKGLNNAPKEINTELNKCSSLLGKVKQIESENGRTSEWSQAYKEWANSVDALKAKLTTLRKEQSNIASTQVFKIGDLKNNDIAYMSKVYNTIEKQMSEINKMANAKGWNIVDISGVEQADGKIKQLTLTVKDAEGALKRLTMQREKLQGNGKAQFGLMQVGDIKVIETASQAQEKLAQSAAKANTKLSEQVNKIQLSIDNGTYESKVDALVAKTMQWTDVNGNARISTNELSNAFDQLTTASNNYANSPTEAHQKALIASEKELDNQIKTVTNSVKSMNAELAKDSKISSLHNQLADFMGKNGKAVKYFGNDLRDIFNQTGQGAKLTNQELAVLKQRFIDIQNTARNTGKLGKTWFQTLREGMSSFSYWTSSTFLVMKSIQKIKEAVTFSKELNSVLVNINYTMDVTASQLENIGSKSIEMAKDLHTSAENVLGAVKLYANAKETADSILAKAQPAIMLSNVTGFSGEESAKYLQTIMNQFDLTQDNLMNISDTIQGISQSMAHDFADGIVQINEGIATSGEIARAAGMELADYASMIGLLVEKTGLGGSQLGNSLKTIITRTTKAGKIMGIDEGEISAAETSLRSIGVEVRKTDGEFNAFNDTMSELAKHWDSLSDVEKSNISFNLAGTRQINVIQTLLRNWDEYEDLVNKANNSTGVTFENQEKYAASLEGRIKELSATTTSIGENIFKSDDLSVIVSGLTKIAGLFDTITSKTKLLGSIGLGAGIFAGVKNIGKCRMSVRISNHCYCFEYALHA